MKTRRILLKPFDFDKANDIYTYDMKDGPYIQPLMVFPYEWITISLTTLHCSLSCKRLPEAVLWILLWILSYLFFLFYQYRLLHKGLMHGLKASKVQIFTLWCNRLAFGNNLQFFGFCKPVTCPSFKHSVCKTEMLSSFFRERQTAFLTINCKCFLELKGLTYGIFYNMTLNQLIEPQA